jgi:hypothetical protein
MSRTMTYDQLDVNAFHYKEPTKNSKGGMNAYIDTSATDRSSPEFQLGEKMRVPFGVRDAGIDGNGADNPRKNLELDVADAALQDVINAIDARNIDMAAENSVEWFKKKLTAEQLAATLYRASLTPDATGRFSPLLRVKVAGPGSRTPTKVFVVHADAGTVTYKPGSIDDITAGCHVTPIVKLGGMWFVSKGFGVTFNASYVLVYPSSKPADAFPFVVASRPTDIESKGNQDTYPTNNDDTNAGMDDMDDVM